MILQSEMVSYAIFQTEITEIYYVGTSQFYSLLQQEVKVAATMLNKWPNQILLLTLMFHDSLKKRNIQLQESMNVCF